MGTTAQKLQNIIDSKADISAVIESRGLAVPTSLKDYADMLRYLTKAWDAKVEYLETSGTQYIDTEITPGNNEVEWEFCFDWLTTTSTKSLFGSRAASGYGSGSYVLFSMADSKVRMDCTGGTNRQTPTLTNPIVAKYNATTTTINDTSNTNGSKTSCDYSLIIGSVNTAGTVATSNLAPINIRYCKIWKNQKLVRDFIPVRAGQVGYLLDRVSGRLFGNGGSGSFALGQDV